MRRVALDKYIQKSIEGDRISDSKDEDVGLFTFYRSQEEEQNKLKLKYAKPETNSHQKYQQKSKLNFYGLNRSSINSKYHQKAQLQSSNKNCELFLKNVVSGSNKAKSNQIQIKQRIKKVLADSQIQKDHQTSQQKANETKMSSEQFSPFRRQSIESKEISKYYMALEPEKGFITRPLKRIEQLLSNCQEKISNLKQKQGKSKSETVKKEDEKLFTKTLNQESNSNNIKITKLNKEQQKKVIKISLKKLSGENEMNKSLQKSFLQKIRKKQINQESLQEKQISKQMTSSKTIQSFHDQNKKYLFNLINHCYLPHNQTSLAAKMLRDSLKFPNLIIKNYIVKTQNNEHQDIEITNNIKSFSFRKTKLSPGKVINQSDSQDLKPTMNQRFKFLLRRERTNNDFFKQENPRNTQMRKGGKIQRKVQF